MLTLSIWKGTHKTMRIRIRSPLRSLSSVSKCLVNAIMSMAVIPKWPTIILEC